MSRSKTILLVLIVLMGCKETTSQSEGKLAAWTDATNYVGIARVIVTVANGLNSTVYLRHCNNHIAFYIERKDSTWVDAGDEGILCAAMYASGFMPLKTRESVSDTFCLPQSGHFRLRLPYSLQQDGLNQIYLFSNEYYNYNPR